MKRLSIILMAVSLLTAACTEKGGVQHALRPARFEPGEGVFVITSFCPLLVDGSLSGMPAIAKAFNSRLRSLAGFRLAVREAGLGTLEKGIYVMDAGLPEGQCSLHVSPDYIVIDCGDADGARLGLDAVLSLISMNPPGHKRSAKECRVPCCFAEYMPSDKNDVHYQ